MNHEQSSATTGQAGQGNPEDINGRTAGATPPTISDGKKEEVGLLTSEERHAFLREIARSCASVGIGQSQPNPTFIYVIRSGTHVKIGFAANVENRLRALQTCHYEKLTVIKRWKAIDDGYARLAEKAIHNYYADSHVRGEWFRLSKEKIAEIRAAREIYPYNTQNPFLVPTREMEDEYLIEQYRSAGLLIE